MDEDKIIEVMARAHHDLARRELPTQHIPSWGDILEEAREQYHKEARTAWDAAKAALAEAGFVIAPDWQPIETAPKNGTPIDIWTYEPGNGAEPDAPGSRLAGARWHPHDERWIKHDCSILRRRVVVTHWRPEPAAPDQR